MFEIHKLLFWGMHHYGDYHHLSINEIWNSNCSSACNMYGLCISLVFLLSWRGGQTTILEEVPPNSTVWLSCSPQGTSCRSHIDCSIPCSGSEGCIGVLMKTSRAESGLTGDRAAGIANPKTSYVCTCGAFDEHFQERVTSTLTSLLLVFKKLPIPGEHIKDWYADNWKVTYI